MKGLVVLFLIGRRKAALLGDTTIYGACVGAGFGLLENILHLASGTAYVDAWEAISMGLEAAVMHIGCTSTLAMMLIMAWQGKFGQLRWNKGEERTIHPRLDRRLPQQRGRAVVGHPQRGTLDHPCR